MLEATTILLVAICLTAVAALIVRALIMFIEPF